MGFFVCRTAQNPYRKPGGLPELAKILAGQPERQQERKMKQQD